MNLLRSFVILPSQRNQLDKRLLNFDSRDRKKREIFEKVS
jgi:hypothetical protein